MSRARFSQRNPPQQMSRAPFRVTSTDAVALTGLDLSVSEGLADPEWNAFVASAPGGNYLQTSTWARVKAAVGLRAVRIVLRREGAIVCGCQMFIREAPLLGGVAYVPLGPVMGSADPAIRAAFLHALDRVARRTRVAFLKLQPATPDPHLQRELAGAGFVTSDLSVAPTCTVRIAVAGRSDEELLARMRASTRGNLRRGDKSAVRVESRGAAGLPILQEQLEATARRQGFAAYEAAYQQRLWEAFATEAEARLLVAELDGEPLASAMLVAFGDTVVHKVAGWSRTASKVRPNELIHWHAMRWARDAGYAFYDLGGISPEAVRALREDGDAARRDPRNGVAFFKLGLGGEVVDGPPAFDRPMPTMRGRTFAALAPHLQRRRAMVARIAGRSR